MVQPMGSTSVLNSIRRPSVGYNYIDGSKKREAREALCYWPASVRPCNGSATEEHL